MSKWDSQFGYEPPRVHARKEHAPHRSLCDSRAAKPVLVVSGATVTCKICLRRLEKQPANQGNLFGGSR